MRLIDADKLTELVRLQLQDALDGANVTNMTIFKQKAKDCENFIELIKDAPTAFDLEEVVERLEELRMAEYDDSDEEPCYTDVEDWYDEGESSGRFEAYGKAIEIVKEEMKGE